MSKSIIIADSSTIGKIGLRAVIGKLDGFQVINEVETSSELLESYNTSNPDLVIIDFLSEGFDIDVIVKIKREYVGSKILAVTPMQSSQTFIHAMRAGVDSYIKKSCDLQEITDAIKITSNGTSFFCGKILEEIRKASIDVDDLSNVDEFPCDAIELSKREKEVLYLISEGNTNSEIADILFLSSHTVTTHRKNIMIKLGVKNTAGIVMYAVKSGIVSPNKFLFQAS
ncbi:MAG: response regulator transcription factor [Bacteroidota bacterium]|nr:response regulator transcription factor [Bacteroidota bacterium]